MTRSRRRFLGESSSIAAVAALWGCAPPIDGEGPADEAASREEAQPAQLGASRLVLPEAGPMVPPVPAVLLTINGAEGDPDEISVLWTFVVNGDPPQVGVAAGSEHLARRLLELHGEFVLNVPTAAHINAFDTVDMNSSRVADKFVDDEGRLIVPAVPFFGMTAGSGEHYTMGQRVGNIGMTVGRTDIKY